MTQDEVRKISQSLPEVTERPAWDIPCFRVRDKIFVSMADEKWIAVKTTYDEREALCAGDPGTYSITDHYRNYPMVVVQLASVKKDELRELITEAWRLTAPKKLAAAHAEL